MLLSSPARVAADAPATLLARGLGKEYRVYASARQRLWSLLTGASRFTSHWALRDVSLQLQRGQCLGLIGDNGAGKSTLLKLLTGTLQPTQGRLERRGRVTAILELGAGFHPDFTGRQNLYFGGSLIGIGAAQMRQLEPEIIAFAELAQAMDRPLKTYSSGMVVRLAFALVTAVEPDLLIIDEALAVGDQHFQKKCVERIEAFRNNGCTILFCSHSLYHVQRLCDSALWLHQGRPRALGPTPEVIAAYEAHVRSQALAGQAGAESLAPGAGAATQAAQSTAPAHAHIEGVELPDVLPAPGADCGRLGSPHLRITIRARAPAGEQPHMGVMLEQVGGGVGITTAGTHVDGARPVQDASGAWVATVTFTDLPLHTGQYSVSAYLFDAMGLVVYDEHKDCARFQHVLPGSTPGLVHLPHHWS
ncbi:ABC transporter ATP-binding protein [Comamonas sp. NLF-1-9]|uniref:ABC transporter ATP-binding protein n=1 Tax=Comamonas sp. NLF-1-9 TaxID=2853163 RepID=UPI001C47E0DE|nr:ABC transporter ATP-binding protein [Comamonas sp. NLF-1-9]QXL83547.1 ABC transporter ATP-binding protein [Comamonas sp. NLF-1-9]